MGVWELDSGDDCATCWNLDVDGLRSSGGPGAPTLPAGGGDDLALPVATSAGGLHVEQSRVDHLLGNDGSSGDSCGDSLVHASHI